MGWWNQNVKGESLIMEPENTGMYWGDSVADIMDDAIDAIVKEFKEWVGRKPTVAELEAGLKFSLGIYEEDDKVGKAPWDEEEE